MRNPKTPRALAVAALAAVLAVPAAAQSLAEILDADTRAATAAEQARAAKEEAKAKEAKALASGSASPAAGLVRVRRVRDYQLVGLYGVDGGRMVVVSVDGMRKFLREAARTAAPVPEVAAAAPSRKPRGQAAPAPAELRLVAIEGSCVQLAGPSDAPGRLCYVAPPTIQPFPLSAAADPTRLPAGLPPLPGLPGLGLPPQSLPMQATAAPAAIPSVSAVAPAPGVPAAKP